MVAGALAVFGLCACDDETTAAPDSPAISVLESGKKMDDCSKDNAGEMVYVTDSAAVFYCADGKWQTLNGKDGADGKDGTDGKNGADGKNGSDGNDGSDGKDGENGADGQGGSSGRDTVVVNNRDTVVVRDTLVVVNRDTVVIKETVGAGSSGSGTSLTGKPNWVYLNPAIDYGEITDERDGQVYKTVKIGDQVWMAENLNYAYTGVPYDCDGNTSDSISWCYDNDPAECAKFGRLYTWAAAMDSVGTWSTNGSGCGYDDKECSPTYPVRGICPKGWHLPSDAEIKTLFDAVGDEERRGFRLKAVVGWKPDFNANDEKMSIDSFGFSALPAKIRKPSGGFTYTTEPNTRFWSATEQRIWNSDDRVYEFYTAYRISMSYASDGASLDYDHKNYGYSVRCLKD